MVMVKTHYEMSREQRIKENRERMQKLGIVDLSLQVKLLKPSQKRSYNNRKTQQGYSPSPCSGPLRRSSRLQKSTPVSYCEVRKTKKDWSLNDNNFLREEASKPEAYTKEHEKLLGSTEMEWTLFVDGYGKDHRRIYDPINGKTCHQCRQKTLGHRTRCSKCTLVQGQFCGDCLYIRYGENILEANANPEWICPVCRGICNCSLCRKAKGWAPTGPLYNKISRLGYKSVAHYLLAQTRLETTGSDETPVGSKITCSAKRSLPFSDTDGVIAGQERLCNSNHEGDTETGHPLVTEERCSNEEDYIITKSARDEKNTSISEVLGEKGMDKETAEEDDNTILDNQDSVGSAKSSTKKKREIIFEPLPDSIAARLRRRRNDADSIGIRLKMRRSLT